MRDTGSDAGAKTDPRVPEEAGTCKSSAASGLRSCLRILNWTLPPIPLGLRNGGMQRSRSWGIRCGEGEAAGLESDDVVERMDMPVGLAEVGPRNRWGRSVADLDRLFRLRATGVLIRAGYLRFWHWRLYGERGLAGERAAVWVGEEAVTIEYAIGALAQYRVTLEADGRRLREAGEPRLFVKEHAAPQPFLAPLEDVVRTVMGCAVIVKRQCNVK
jgi:hypothetical protein